MSHPHPLSLLQDPTLLKTEGLIDVMTRGAWVDLMRRKVPAEEKLYTWWSYRSADWQAANKGRRLDHIWSSADLDPHLTNISVIR